jgi:hypothetical protein
MSFGGCFVFGDRIRSSSQARLQLPVGNAALFMGDFGRGFVIELLNHRQ